MTEHLFRDDPCLAGRVRPPLGGTGTKGRARRRVGPRRLDA